MPYKFKIGDIISPKPDHYGFHEAKVLGTFIERKGKNKGKEYYKLGIMNGVAFIPIDSQSNYQIHEEKIKP